MGIAESGYAFRINNGPDARQEVFHLHAHVMGGRKMGMP
jgi:histidine triad (HIT) family protein